MSAAEEVMAPCPCCEVYDCVPATECCGGPGCQCECCPLCESAPLDCNCWCESCGGQTNNKGLCHDCGRAAETEATWEVDCDK